MSKLFNFGTQRPSSISKRPVTSEFDNDLGESSQVNAVDTNIDVEDITSAQNIPSASPPPPPSPPIPPPPPPPLRAPSSPTYQPPMQSTSYLSDPIQPTIPHNREAYYPPRQKYQYPPPPSHAYLPQNDNMMPQRYFVPNQQPQISEEEYKIMKGKNTYLEERVAQLKCALDYANERAAGSEQALHELKQLFMERENVLGSLQENERDNIDILLPTQDSSHSNHHHSNNNNHSNKFITTNNNSNNAASNQQIEELKTAIKSLEARLLKSETERINNYHKYEMEHLKLILQSGFTSIQIINVEDQVDRVHYFCSIKGKDGTLHFTLIYPKNESDEAEYIPQLNYSKQKSSFIRNLDQVLKCKMSFQPNALPGLMQLLLKEIPKQPE